MAAIFRAMAPGAIRAAASVLRNRRGRPWRGAGLTDRDVRSYHRRPVRIAVDHPQPAPELEIQLVAFALLRDEPGRCLRARHRMDDDVLAVHAAAHAPPLAPAPHLADKDFDASLEVNFRATARLVVMLQPLLAAAPSGRFVYVADNRAGQPFFGAYGASKAGAEAFVRSWAAETARIGPAVLLFHPNPMPTALRARFYPGEDRTALTPCATEAARLLALLDGD